MQATKTAGSLETHGTRPRMSVYKSTRLAFCVYTSEGFTGELLCKLRPVLITKKSIKGMPLFALACNVMVILNDQACSSKCMIATTASMNSLDN